MGNSLSWAGCQNNLIDVNFHHQKCLESFVKKISLPNLIKKDKVVKIKSIPLRAKQG